MPYYYTKINGKPVAEVTGKYIFMKKLWFSAINRVIIFKELQSKKLIDFLHNPFKAQNYKFQQLN